MPAVWAKVTLTSIPRQSLRSSSSAGFMSGTVRVIWCWFAGEPTNLTVTSLGLAENWLHSRALLTFAADGNGRCF